MLRCIKCGRTYPDEFMLVCECGGLLDAVSEFEKPFGDLLRKEYLDIRRYLSFLPVREEHAPRLTLPVTPIVEREINGVNAIFKLEYLMPSGSFKDRGTYVTVAKLKEAGIEEVVLDSSGNAAISLAMFGKSEGLKVHIFLPKSTHEGKKRILRNLGAEIHEIKGSRMRTHEAALEFGQGTYISHWLNPYFLEGTKTAAYEVFEQIGDVDYVIVPAGSGSLFLGLYKGFRELSELGLIEMLPSMIAVQAGGYESLCSRSREKSRLAEGIAIPEPPRREQMLKVLRETGGTCISVGDGEIEAALRKLWDMGFLVEPTSAVVLAALKKLTASGRIEGKSRVLLPLTGSGLKTAALPGAPHKTLQI